MAAFQPVMVESLIRASFSAEGGLKGERGCEFGRGWKGDAFIGSPYGERAMDGSSEPGLVGDSCRFISTTPF